MCFQVRPWVPVISSYTIHVGHVGYFWTYLRCCLNTWRERVHHRPPSFCNTLLQMSDACYGAVSDDALAKNVNNVSKNKESLATGVSLNHTYSTKPKNSPTWRCKWRWHLWYKLYLTDAVVRHTENTIVLNCIFKHDSVAAWLCDPSFLLVKWNSACFKTS